MNEHSEHFRNKISTFQEYEKQFQNETLLNCGVFGGEIQIMKLFIEKLWAIHRDFNCNNKSAFTGDMGAFNFLVRTQFNEQLIHGKPVNTEFKAYETNSICWFKHK